MSIPEKITADFIREQTYADVQIEPVPGHTGALGHVVRLAAT